MKIDLLYYALLFFLSMREYWQKLPPEGPEMKHIIRTNKLIHYFYHYFYIVWLGEKCKMEVIDYISHYTKKILGCKYTFFAIKKNKKANII